jgi:hypothetical protein
VIDQIQKGRLGPVNIFEHDEQRTLARECLEEPTHRPKCLLSCAADLGAANRARDAAEYCLSVRVIFE